MLAELDWRDRAIFQQGLAATLAKSPEDRRIFDLVFERFFFRAAEAAAIDAGVVEAGGGGASGDAAQQIDLEQLRAQIAEALAAGDEGRMQDLARLALAAIGRARPRGPACRHRRAADPAGARPARRAPAGIPAR